MRSIAFVFAYSVLFIELYNKNPRTKIAMDMALRSPPVATEVDTGVPRSSTELICQLRCDVATGPGIMPSGFPLICATRTATASVALGAADAS